MMPPVEAPESRPVTGRWISQSSAQRNLGLFKPAEISSLRRFARVRYSSAGMVVAAAGSRVTTVQIVVDGELELMARTDSGRATMAVVRSGGVIADIPLLLGAPMPFDAVASRDTQCIELSKQRWTELLTTNTSLALRWMTSIARRLDDDRRRLVVVTSRPLMAQVAYLLLDLQERDSAQRCVARLSHTTIAHLLGARRQSVTRVVGELRERGLIETGYGVIELLDLEGLADVMGPDPLP
jgi:CRP-like cAMP-binding protein